MEKREDNSKKVLLSVLGVAILVVAVVGISFAAFTYSKSGTVSNTITTGTLTITYTEGQTGINISNALPMSDALGKVQSKDNEQFKFTVGATLSKGTIINYEIAAIKKDGSTIADSNVRLYLEKSTDGVNYSQVFAPAQFTPLTAATELGSPVGSMILEKSVFNETSNHRYILRMWLAEDAVLGENNESYTVTVNVYGKV